MKTRIVDIPVRVLPNWKGVIQNIPKGKAIEIPVPDLRRRESMRQKLYVTALRYGKKVRVSQRKPGVLIVWEVQ